MSPILNKKRVGLFYCILIVSFFVISILRPYKAEAFPGFEKYGNDSVRIEQYSPTSHSHFSHHRPSMVLVYSNHTWVIKHGYTSVNTLYNLKDLIIDLNTKTVRYDDGDLEEEEAEQELEEAVSDDGQDGSTEGGNEEDISI